MVRVHRTHRTHRTRRQEGESLRVAPIGINPSRLLQGMYTQPMWIMMWWMSPVQIWTVVLVMEVMASERLAFI